MQAMRRMATTTRIDCGKAGQHDARYAVLSRVALLGVLHAYGSVQAQSAEWRVVPSVGLRSVYTDNVRLSPDAERSDFVFEVSPGVAVTFDGPRLKLRSNYAFQYLTYAQDNTKNSSYHRLDGLANLEVIDELFWIDGGASINQQTLGLAGPRPTSNIPVTDNRTTVRTFNLSPYLRHEYGSAATTELRYTRALVDSGSNNLSNNDIDRLSATVASGSAFRTLGWTINYSMERAELNQTSKVDSKTMLGSARYMVTPQFYLNASAGYDDYDYPVAPGKDDPKGASYTAGFSWRPTDRTTLDLSAGRRFYGSTYQASASLRRRHALWRLSYDETVSTTPAQFAFGAAASTAEFLDQLFSASIPDDALRQQAIDRFILEAGLPSTLTSSINYFTNQVFIQKALRLSTAITGAKNTIIFSAYRLERENQTSNAGTTDPGFQGFANPGDTRQTGANASWTLRLGPRSNATLTADTSKTEADLNVGNGRLNTYRLAYTHRLRPNASGGLELRRAQQTGNTLGNYQENALSAFLLLRF